MLSALRLPGVRWILSMHGADLALEYASSVALMVLVYDTTNSPLAAAAMLCTKQVAPGALAALASRRLESTDPRVGLAVAYLIRAAAFVALAQIGGGAVMFALAFLAGSAGVASRVLVRTTVVRATSGQTFRDVSALQNIIFGTVALVGPGLGALLAATAGAGWSLAIWAATAVAMAIAAGLLPRSVHTPATGLARHDADELPATGPAQRRVAAPLWALLALGTFVTCVFSMDEPALLAYARDGLGGDVGTYGAILVAWGGGMVAGSALYAALGARHPYAAIVVGVAANATGYIVLGFAPGVEVATAAAIIGGAGNGTYWVALVTAVLERAPTGHEAAASGRLEGMATAMPAIGFMLGGLLAQVASPRVSLWAPGMAALVGLAVWMLVCRRSLAPAAPVVDRPSTAPARATAAEVIV